MNEEQPEGPPRQPAPHLPRRTGAPAPPVRAIDLLLVLAITAAALLLVGTQISAPRLTTEFVIAMLAIQSAIPIAAIYLVIIRWRGLSWSALGFRPAPRHWYGYAVLIALLTLPAVALVNLLTQGLVGVPFRNPQLDLLAPDGFTWRGLIGMIVMVGIVAPIVEEVVFRGLLYGWLRRHIGVAAGAVVSAVVFAAVHGIPVLLPALAVTGLVLAIVYERSGSLWPPIIVHGIFNTMMTVALYAALAADLSLD